jgi:hypothetical protein
VPRRCNKTNAQQNQGVTQKATMKHGSNKIQSNQGKNIKTKEQQNKEQ